MYPPSPPTGHTKAKSGGAEERAARKTVARVDKQLARLAVREAELNQQLLDNAADHEVLTSVSRQLSGLAAERDALEQEWLEAAALLE